MKSSHIIRRRSKVFRLQMLAYSQKQYEKVAQATYLIGQLDRQLLTNLQNYNQ